MPVRDYDCQQPLIFIHVPKSAGTSVRGVVNSWFPNNFHRHYYDETHAKLPDKMLLSSPEMLQNPPVIYGHFNKHRGFGIEEYYPNVSQFLTILRDPFETVLSHYFFARTKTADWKDQSRIPRENLENHLMTVKPNILNHFPQEMTAMNFKDILEERFIEIGITEDLPTSLSRMAKVLTKEFDPTCLKVTNVTERDQTVPQHFRDQFAEANPLEFAVYEFAKSRIVGP